MTSELIGPGKMAGNYTMLNVNSSGDHSFNPYDGHYSSGYEIPLEYQHMLKNLTFDRLQVIQNYTWEGIKCMLDFWYSPPPAGE